MSKKGNYWDPNTYSIENRLEDMMGGRDVICGEGAILKGGDCHVDVFWPSSSKQGHGHGGFDFDENGNIKPINPLYHE